MRREKDVASSFLLLAALFATTSVSFAAASVLKDSDGHMLGCVRGAGAASSQLAAECDVHVIACTFLTFRYEWRYLREWIAHHSVAGVASFAFWIDSLTSNTTHNLHEKWASVELDALARLPGVSVFTRGLDASGKLEVQGSPLLKKCQDHARSLGADWVFEADVDEVLLTGATALDPAATLGGGIVPEPATSARCRNSAEQGVLGVARALRSLAHTPVAALVLPRKSFLHGDVATPPPGRLQTETYTWRDAGADAWSGEQARVYSGKLLVRVRGVSSPVGWGMHDAVVTDRRRRLVVRSTDALPLEFNGSAGFWLPSARDAHHNRELSDFASHNLRMHHYVTRSMQECERKQRDTAAAVASGSIPSSWRLTSSDAARMCEPHTPRQRNGGANGGGRLTRDVSAACWAPRVRERIELLRDAAWGDAL